MNGKFLLILLLLILWLILGLFFCNKYLCGITAPAVPAAVPASTCGGEWDIKDGSKSIAEANTHYKFKRSSFEPMMEGSALTSAMDKTANYLKKNPNKFLTITGYYDAKEKTNSILNNLGEARANSIKKILTSKGVPGNQMDIAGELANRDCFTRANANSKTEANKTGVNANNANKNGIGNVLQKGATFGFSKMSKSNDRIAAIKSRLHGKPITLYFGTNQDNISLTGQQRTDFTDLNYYLDNVSSAKLDVAGHTDNVGARPGNVALSKKRAEFVRDYLTRNGGIGNARMDVAGFGPDKPVAANTTPEGKAKNRRVEVTLK